MAVQTTYGERQKVGFPGLVANMETANSITRVINDVAGLGFGLPAFQVAGEDLAATGTVGTLFRGVTIRDVTLVAKEGQTVDVYQKGDNAGLLTLGVIWVTAGEAVAAGDAAYFNTTTKRWMKTSSGNTAIPRAIFDSAAVDGGLAKVRLT